LHRARGDTLETLQARTNHIPYKAIGYAFPHEMLERMLA